MTASTGVGRGGPGQKRGRYTVHEKGPGYCRNGHKRDEVGFYVAKEGYVVCKKCKSDGARERYKRTLGAERARARAAKVVIADPSIIDRDVADMRARVAARKGSKP